MSAAKATTTGSSCPPTSGMRTRRACGPWAWRTRATISTPVRAGLRLAPPSLPTPGQGLWEPPRLPHCHRPQGLPGETMCTGLWASRCPPPGSGIAQWVLPSRPTGLGSGWQWLSRGSRAWCTRPNTLSLPVPPWPLPGMLYRYTLLLYGTAEDMTERPSDPQVTSSACVQRDTEGLCQGEWPAPRGPLAGRRQPQGGQCVCAAQGGLAAGGPRGRQQPHALRVCVPRAECDGPAYILGHLCLSYCPPRYFNSTQPAVTAGPGRGAAPALRVCSSCHASCYTCRGSSAHDCTACPPPHTLDEHQGSCSGLPSPVATSSPWPLPAPAVAAAARPKPWCWSC